MLYRLFRRCGLLIALLLVLGVACLSRSQTADATTGVNPQMNFQARLMTSSGAIVADGNYNIRFKIYQDGTGCVSSGSSPCSGTLKWTETRQNNASQGVVVKNGYFSVNLGSVTAFASNVDWNQDTLWLSIDIGGTTTGTPTYDGEMLPFKRLTSSPYAMNADKLDGIDSTTFARQDTTNTFTQNQTVNATLTATTLSSTLLQSTGAVAINAATSNNINLQINGSTKWSVLSTGELQGNGASTINTSSGALTLATTAANANILLTPNGTGSVVVGTVASPASKLEVGGDINIASGSSLKIGGVSICTSSGCTGGGGGSYINNGTSQQASANFNISGSGATGTTFFAGGSIGSDDYSGLQSQANNFNMAPNSSFEVNSKPSGVVDGWGTSTTAGNGSATMTRVSDAQSDGLYSMKTTLTGTTSSAFTNTTAYLPVKPSTTYFAAADVVHDVTANSCASGLYVQIDWYTSARAFISISSVVANSATTTSWANYGGSATAPSNAAFAVVVLANFQVASNPNGCTRWFDNAIFRPVSFSGDLTVAGTTTISGALTVTNAASISSGTLTLNNGTSNVINYGQNGVAAPSFTSRSAGTKLVLYNSLSGTSVDYAIGISSGTLWNSVGTGGQFQWYGNTAVAATLSNGGNLTLAGNLTTSALQNASALTLSTTASNANILLTPNGSGSVVVGTVASPTSKLEIGGDVNISSGSAYKINGTNICTSSGCTAASGSNNYIQNTTTPQASANFNIGGNGDIGGTLSVVGNIGGDGLSGLNATSGNLNVAPNPSFETNSKTGGTVDGWTITNTAGNGSAATTRDNTQQDDGVYSMKTVLTGTTSAAQIATTGFIPVSPAAAVGQGYTASVDAKNDATANSCANGFYLRLDGYTSTGTATGSTNLINNSATTTSWTTYTAPTLALGPTTTQVKLVLLSTTITSNPNGCTRWFDNLIFHQSIFNGPLTVTGALGTGGNLSVTGTSTLSSATSVNSTLTVSGVSAFGNSSALQSSAEIIDVNHTFSGNCGIGGCYGVATKAQTSVAQGLISGYSAATGTAAGSYTVGSARGLTTYDVTVGSGSTVTSDYGIYVNNVTNGGTNNYGIYVAGASTYGLWVDSGDTRLDGNLQIGDGTGKVLDLDTKSSSTDPSGTDGAMYFNSALEQFRCYRDGLWEACANKPIDRMFSIEDEFMDGAVGATGLVGALSWQGQTLAGTACSAFNYGGGTGGTAITDDRPGILKFTTGSVANTGCRIMLGQSGAGTINISAGTVIKSAVAVGATTNNVMRVGIEGNTNVVSQSATTGVWWEADPSANSGNWRFCWATGSSTVCQNPTTPVAIAANTFVRVAIKIVSSTSIDYTINGTTYNTGSITLGAGQASRPSVACYTTAASAQNCYIDYYQLRRDASAAR